MNKIKTSEGTFQFDIDVAYNILNDFIQNTNFSDSDIAEELFHQGVSVRSISNGSKIIKGAQFNGECTVAIVASWGIVHHVDDPYFPVNILIPYNQKGTYYIKYQDQDNNTQEHLVERMKPIVFLQHEYHSLAPVKRNTNPFVALLVELKGEKDECE
jgi:hypothetical protein